MSDTVGGSGSKEIPNFGPYSAVRRSGDHVWTSGFVGLGASREVPDGGFEGQMRLAMSYLAESLRSVGASLSDVVSVNVYLADRSDQTLMNTLYREYFSDPLPARTAVTVTLGPDVLFEIDAQAFAGRAEASA